LESTTKLWSHTWIVWPQKKVPQFTQPPFTYSISFIDGEDYVHAEEIRRHIFNLCFCTPSFHTKSFSFPKPRAWVHHDSLELEKVRGTILGIEPGLRLVETTICNALADCVAQFITCESCLIDAKKNLELHRNELAYKDNDALILIAKKVCPYCNCTIIPKYLYVYRHSYPMKARRSISRRHIQSRIARVLEQRWMYTLR
jgi:hypothetical protein